MKRSVPVEPLSWSLRTFALATDTSVATIRRRMKDDPSFPPTFRLSETGDLRVLADDARAWIMSKAARQQPAGGDVQAA